MPVSNAFLDFVQEQIAALGVVTSRRFFGGRGIYLDGLIVAFIIDDVLHFKVDDLTRHHFAAEASKPFIYQTKLGAQTINGYWQAPERLFDDPDAMHEFALLALAASRRADAAKRRPPKPARKR